MRTAHREVAGERCGRTAGGGIFRQVEPGGEHAGMDVRTGPLAALRKDEDFAAPTSPHRRLPEVEPELRSRDGRDVAHGHERVGHPARQRLWPPWIIAKIRWLETEKRCDGRASWRNSVAMREPGRRQLRKDRTTTRAANGHPHRPNAFLEHDIRDVASERDFADRSEHVSRSDRRMSGERKLRPRREDPHASCVRGVVRRIDECRLGEIEFARDVLQALFRDSACVGKHRELVAAERLVGEHVSGDEAILGHADKDGVRPASAALGAAALSGLVVDDT